MMIETEMKNALVARVRSSILHLDYKSRCVILNKLDAKVSSKNNKLWKEAVKNLAKYLHLRSIQGAIY